MTRAIFEEVGAAKPAPPPPPPQGIQTENWRAPLRLWFGALAFLVIATIAIGGLTRLSDSGLSITEWQLIKGILPPMSEPAWELAFNKYREIPEYRLQNNDMTLAEFKRIYWWEWAHRQLGRVIGLVWAVGFLIFAVRRIPQVWLRRAAGVGALGGLQGAIGWWMVSSGLGTGLDSVAVDVASYRLAIHLGLAFIILSILAWFVWILGQSSVDIFAARRSADKKMLTLGRALWAVAFVQIILGALVAGIDAGLVFNDWPMMNGAFFPADSFFHTPAWRNFFENHGLVQFNHRLGAYVLVALSLWAWMKSRAASYPPLRGVFGLVLLVVIAQALLGITALILVTPPTLGFIHQLGAIVVLLLVLRACFVALYPVKGVLR